MTGRRIKRILWPVRMKVKNLSERLVVFVISRIGYAVILYAFKTYRLVYIKESTVVRFDVNGFFYFNKNISIGYDADIVNSCYSVFKHY